MAIWNAQAAITNPAWNGPVTGPEAVAAATAELNAVLNPIGWSVVNATGSPVYAVGDWVLANRQVGASTVADYGRIVDSSGTLQVEFGDGTRRALSTVIRRVQ